MCIQALPPTLTIFIQALLAFLLLISDFVHYYIEKSSQNKKDDLCNILWFVVREDINEKKTFSFGHCPNHLNPPPLTPIRATWSFFFGRQNSLSLQKCGEGRYIKT